MSDIRQQSAAQLLTFPVSDVEPQFRLFAHTMPNQVWAATPDGLLYWLSDSALRYTDLEHDALIGTGWAQIVHPDDLALALPNWSAAIASGVQYETEFRLRRADGAYRWFLARAVPLREKSGEITGWVGSNTDIDDQKRAVEEAASLSTKLLQAQGELQSILNSAGSAFYSVDKEGHTTLCNTEFLRLLGYNNEAEVVGRKLHGEIHHTHIDGSPHPVEDCPIYQCASTGREAHIRSDVFFRNDGQRVPVEYWARAIHRNGQHVGAICTFNDISERIALEEQHTLIARELEHRGKNTLSLVQAIVTQSLRSAPNLKDANEAISQRLTALGQTHDLLTKTSWTGASVEDVVARAVPAHEAWADRIEITGPPLQLGPKSALSLSLAIHELCTNAAKYGALSNATGRVNVVWKSDQDAFSLEWRETGGPQVEAPSRRGFGSRLVSTSFGADSGGRAEHLFEAGGVIWRVGMPITAMQS